jgi:toxin ParE1/3/4
LRGQRWRVRLSEPASADIREIFRWTADRFGEAQANAYGDILLAALDALCRGPRTVGVSARPDIAQGLYTLHVSRNRRRGRHIILFRLGQDRGQPLGIVDRVLHDSMDIARHLPSDTAEKDNN